MVATRIYVIIKKILLSTTRDFARISDMFFWPFVDITIWGFTGSWIQDSQHGNPALPLMLLCAIVVWQATWRASIDVTVSLFDELTSRNLLNLFVSPLQLGEWAVAVMTLGLLKTCIMVPYSAFIVWFIYGINIFSGGWGLFVCLALLIMSGWFIGFLAACCLLLWGQKMQTIMWMSSWIFLPFSGVFYSISVLPAWAQTISHGLPMTYIFESIRMYIVHGSLPMNYMVLGAGLNLLYLACALVLFKFSFECAKGNGLMQLEKE
jgi:ABC-2 type transport system permease protein